AVKNAIAAAQYSFGVAERLIGKTKSRGKVVLVSLVQVAAQPVGPDLDELPRKSVEAWNAIASLGERRNILITETDIESQLRRGFPVILYIERGVILPDIGESVPDRHRSVGGIAQQKVGHRISGIRHAG